MSKKKITQFLLLTSSSMLLPIVAQAQEATANKGQLEEIVVTARRTAEALQDTPVSVTAFSQNFLDRQNIQQVDKIAQFTPNLIISRQPSSLTAASILIRGVGQTEPSAVAEPGVGMYLDGVYIARTGGAILDLVDLERVEVLRGPQGTLFGRNTIGGAVQLVSRKPTDEFGLEQKLGYGSFNSWYTKTTVNTGLIGGSPFKATLSYLHRQKDGWVDNLLTPSHLDPNALNSDAIWIRVHGDLSDKLKVDYSFDWNDRKGAPPYFQLVGASSSVETYFRRSAGLGGDPLIFERERLRTGRQEGFTDRNGKYRWDSRAKSQGHSLTFEYEAGDFLTLKSISAYRTFSQDSILGLSGNGNLLGVVFDGTSPTLTSVQRVTTYQGNNAPQKQSQYSQEFQATGHFGDISYVGGIYYFYEKAREFNHQFLTLVTTPAGLVNLGFPQAVADGVIALNPGLDLIGVNARPPAPFGGTAESYAIFGQASWRPSALDGKMELTGGIRQTSDHKTIFIGDGTPGTVYGHKNFSNVSWLASANYKFTDDLMIYGRVSTGYKGGGFNPRTAVLNEFNPETVLAYEAGVKAEWFDHRLRTNLALYRTNYKDRQINQFAAGAQGATSIIVNAGRAVIQGVEFEGTAVPVDGLTLSGSLGYTDAKFKRFDFVVPGSPPGTLPINVADEARFGNIPKWNWSVAGQYDFPSFGFGELSARVDYSYRSKMFFFPLDRVNTFNKDVASPGQGTLNGRLTLSEIALGGTGAKMEVAVYGENLLDNDKLAYGIDFGGLGFGGAYFAEPRSFGVDVKFTY